MENNKKIDEVTKKMEKLVGELSDLCKQMAKLKGKAGYEFDLKLTCVEGIALGGANGRSFDLVNGEQVYTEETESNNVNAVIQRGQIVSELLRDLGIKEQK